MSLIKEKSNLKSDSIYKVIVILAIEKIISENRINKITLSNILIEKKIINSFLKKKKNYLRICKCAKDISNNKTGTKKFFYSKISFLFYIFNKKTFYRAKI